MPVCSWIVDPSKSLFISIYTPSGSSQNPAETRAASLRIPAKTSAETPAGSKHSPATATAPAGGKNFTPPHS
jgi:hypothetical protein